MNSAGYRKRGIVRICPECHEELGGRSHHRYSCENPSCDVFSVSFSQTKPLGTVISKIVYAAVPRVVIT